MSDPTVALRFTGSSSDLTSTYDKVSGATRRMTDDVEGSASRVATASERSSGRTKAAFGAMATGVAGFVGGMVASTGADMLTMGGNLEAMDVKAKTVFQDQLPRIQAWAEANRKAFGESTRSVTNMAAGLADLLKPMGFTAEQAANMSMKTLDLAGALAKWSGGAKTTAEVSDILSAAFLGERDALQSLGISISQAEVDARLAAQGQQDLTGAARQQAEALITQQLIMEKSTDAQKAWADGGKEAAEAQNGASSSVKQSMEDLAIALQPLILFLTQVFGSIMQWAANHQAAVIAIAAVTAGIWALNVAMNANPIMLVISLIALLVGALIYLWNNSESFRNFFINMWNGIKTVVGAVVDWIKGAWNGVVDFFSKLPDRIAGFFRGMGDAIKNAFKGAVNFVIDMLNHVVDFFNKIIYGINLVNPFSDIPSIPHIPRMHSGGIVPGAPGTEHLRILQAGEEVIPANRRGSATNIVVTLNVAGNADSAAGEFINTLIRKRIINPDVASR